MGAGRPVAKPGDADRRTDRLPAPVRIFEPHIHMASPGVNGPIVVWLYPSAPPAQLEALPGLDDGAAPDRTGPARPWGGAVGRAEPNRVDNEER